MSSETWIAIGSLGVSAAAFFTALRADARAQAVTRTQIFLELREEFLTVLALLPPESLRLATPLTPEQHAAAVRYWHHAYDEWYVARELNASLMGRLWQRFYLPAIHAGLGHLALRRTLDEILVTQPDLARLWQPFCRDIGVDGEPAESITASAAP